MKHIPPQWQLKNRRYVQMLTTTVFFSVTVIVFFAASELSDGLPSFFGIGYDRIRVSDCQVTGLID